MASNKGRILFLLQYLQENTDDTHSVNMNELLSAYKTSGYSATRKTIADDIDELINAGYDITVNNEQHNIYTYSYLGHPFELPELQMLIEAVSSVSFINAETRDVLVGKLSNLTSRHYKDSLLALSQGSKPRGSAGNQLFYVIEAVHEAIGRKKKIRFQYYDYNLDKEKILHNDGEYYTFSPYCCDWSEGRYYMLGQLDKRPGVINPFRIDLMCMPEILEDDILPPDGFDLSEIPIKVFKMYNGEDKTVTLEADSSLMKKMIDRFGTGFRSWKQTEDTFRAEVDVSVSPVFFAWIMQYDGRITIVEPADVRQQYVSQLKRLTAYAESINTANESSKT